MITSLASMTSTASLASKNQKQPALYLLSDFPCIRNLSGLNDLYSLNNLHGLNDLYSLISSKTLLIVMVGSSLAPKWPILVPFCGMDHQKSNFLLILALFLLEAVEASRCPFFENWWMKLKCPLLLKPLANLVQENSQSFYPSEPFRIIHFTMRHPVDAKEG